MKINSNYKNLPESYLFSKIAKKVEEYTALHPQAQIIRMGIGDVTLPICEKAAAAFVKAAQNRGRRRLSMGMARSRDMIFSGTQLCLL